MRIHFVSDLSDSVWHHYFNKEYTESSLDSVADPGSHHFEKLDPDSHHFEKLDPDPLKVKSQGIRIQVRSWIRILLERVLQSEKPGAVEASQCGQGGSSWSRGGSQWS